MNGVDASADGTTGVDGTKGVDGSSGMTTDSPAARLQALFEGTG